MNNHTNFGMIILSIIDRSSALIVNKKINNYSGDLSIVKEDPIFNPDARYNSEITYDEYTQLFNLP